MRPIELILSIQQGFVAEEMQSRQMNDPRNPGGDLAAKELHETARLQETTVSDTQPKDAIDPDDHPKNPREPIHKKNEGQKASAEDNPPFFDDQEDSHRLDFFA